MTHLDEVLYSLIQYLYIVYIQPHSEDMVRNGNPTHMLVSVGIDGAIMRRQTF